MSNREPSYRDDPARSARGRGYGSPDDELVTGTSGASASGAGGMSGSGQSTDKPLSERAAQAAGSTTQQAQQRAGQVVQRAQQQAVTRAEDRKGQAAEMLDNVSRAVGDVSRQLRERNQENVARYADMAGQRVDDLANYLRSHDVNDIVQQAEDVARRRPAIFLGSTFALGLLAARFLKSSGQAGGSGGYRTSPTMPRTGYGTSGTYDPYGYGQTPGPTS